MKIWFLADTHLGMKGDNEIILNDCMGYYNDVLIPYMKKHVEKDDILVHLGDVFDNRSSIGIHTMYSAIKLFEELTNIFNDIRICVGNHDIWQKNSNEITVLHAFKYMKNIKVYFNPEIETICGKSVLFVPWIEDTNKQKELLNKNDVDYVFGHLEINGCVTNNRKGIRMNSDNLVKSDNFKKAQVYAGHIHIRQDYKNIHYVGIPYHKDRGDVGCTNGITILDIETGKTEFVENTYSPKYIIENIYDILDFTVSDLKERWNNNYVDLIVKSSDYSSCNFDKLRDGLCNCFKELNLKSDNSEGIVGEDVNVDIGESKSSGEMLDDYIDACDIENDMKKRIKGIFKELKNKI